MHRRVRQAIDALAYALVVTSILFVLTTAISLPLGVGLLGTKWFLFFIGFALFGYATFRLRPTPPWKDEESEDEEGRGLEQFVAESLPKAVALPPDERLPPAAKLFVAAAAVLLTSFLLEALLRVGY